MTEPTGTPDIADTPNPPCLCEAKLADLTRAIEIMAERSTRHSDAINSLGEQITWIVETVKGVTDKFKDMNPAQLFKGLMNRG